MEIVQLGLFQDIFDWVYENILDPVWEFVSSLISAGFGYLSEVIPVVINAVMGTIIGEAISLLLDWYYKKWFILQSAILLLLDCIEDCFNVVSGIRPVYIRQGGGSGAVDGEAMPLLYAVFKQDMVRNAFLAMIVVGFSVCFAMAIVATARTILELGSDKTKPVSHVIRMTAKSILYLALAPFISVALIMLSQTILITIDKALTSGSGGRTSIARIIFCISSLDAVDTFIHSDGDEYNVSYTEGPSKASVTDKYRKEFYYEDDHWLIPNYTNPLKVRLTFTFHGFDYWIGIGCGIYFTVIMCMVLSVFIGRVMDVIVLLVIQPFFVGMIPFDDGEYYKKWFELFIGKLFQGFGSVIAMRVYLMILEQLFSGNISFSNSKSLGARLQDYLMMLLFAMGGAAALKTMGPLITGILSQAAAQGEQVYAAAGAKVGEAIANKEAGIVKKMAKGDMKKAGRLIGGAAGYMMNRSAGLFRGRGGAGIPGMQGAAGQGIGQFAGKERPPVTGARSLGGNLTDENASSAAQKSLSKLSASLIGESRQGGKAGSGSKGTESVKSGSEERTLSKMRSSVLGEAMTKSNEAGKAGGKRNVVPPPPPPQKGNIGKSNTGNNSTGNNSTGNSNGGNNSRTMQDMVNGGYRQPEGNDGDNRDTGNDSPKTMQDMVGGNSGSMQGGSGGRFEKAPSGNNTGNVVPPPPPPPNGNRRRNNRPGNGNDGGNRTMQDMVGNGGGNRTMQDMVNNGGSSGSGSDNDHGSGGVGGSFYSNPGGGSFYSNQGGGSFDSGSSGSTGNTVNTGSTGNTGNTVNTGSSGSGSGFSGNLGGGSTGNTGSGSVGSGGSGYNSNSGGGNLNMQDIVGSGGGNRSMQDLVGGGQKSMQDIAGGNYEDPLNSAFIQEDDDDQ